LLSYSEIIGLLGEIYYIYEYLKNGGEGQSIIKSWTGTDFTYHDFIFENSWIEIKTILSSASTVKISSIEQLDSNISGNLITYCYEKTSVTDTCHLTLNKVILDVKYLLINSVELMLLFENKLSDFGYFYSDDYNLPAIRIVEKKIYDVNSTFPKLSREHLPEAVQKITYELVLTSIKPWESQNNQERQ
jgi:hypothetical protein